MNSHLLIAALPIVVFPLIMLLFYIWFSEGGSLRLLMPFFKEVPRATKEVLAWPISQDKSVRLDYVTATIILFFSYSILTKTIASLLQGKVVFNSAFWVTFLYGVVTALIMLITKKAVKRAAQRDQKLTQKFLLRTMMMGQIEELISFCEDKKIDSSAIDHLSYDSKEEWTQRNRISKEHFQQAKQLLREGLKWKESKNT